MKKNYFLAKAFAVATVFGLATTANAQYYTENFSYDSAAFVANWATLNADGNTPDPSNANFANDAWIALDESAYPNAYADTAAAANSWYAPAGQSDDWMWTINAIDLTTATMPRLSWTSYSNSSGFEEDYEVYVDTVNTDFGPTTSLTPVATITETNFTETNRFADISTFAGKMIYIAFRQVSNDDDILFIDNIVIAEAPAGPDMVTTASQVEYTMYPLSQATNIVGDANLENIGGDATGATVTVNVWDLSGPTNVYTETSASQDILGGANADFTGFTGFTPSAAGNYFVEYIASVNETETDMSNDTAGYLVQITDSVFARDNGQIVGRLGIGTGNGGQIGNMFELTTQDTITGIHAFIANVDGALNGKDLMAKIYSWDGTASTEMASTVPVTLDSAVNMNTMHDLMIDGNDKILAPGMYIVAVVEVDSNIQVGYTSSNYTVNGTLVNAAGFTTDFTDLSSLFGGSELVPVVRAVFGTPDATTGIANNNVANFEVMPNPAVENILVKNIETGSTVEIFNNLGQAVYRTVSTSSNLNVNVANYDNGIYTIKVTNNDNTTTESFVKQ